MAAVSGGGEEMRAFCAKVVERSWVGGWGDFAANELNGEVVVEACGGEKGLAVGDLGAADENGFWWEVFGANVDLKTLSPRLVGVGSVAGGVWTFVASLFAFDRVAELFETLTPRNPLTDPSFLLQAFLLQLNIYNLRPCPGNVLGRSPFNCISRVINPLQFLHFASSAEGVLVSSSQL